MSIAGEGKVFTDKKSRDEWVVEGCDSYGGRIACTELRYLFRGMSAESYKEYMDYLKTINEL